MTIVMFVVVLTEPVLPVLVTVRCSTWGCAVDVLHVTAGALDAEPVTTAHESTTVRPTDIVALFVWAKAEVATKRAKATTSDERE